MAKVLGMTYTLNTSNPWIYCDYPENVKEEYLGDKGYFINRQSVSAGTGQIFYEHAIPTLTTDLYHGIRIYNGNDSNVTFKVLNYGHANRTSKNKNLESADSWYKFFKEVNAATYTIPAKKSIWICEEKIPAKTGLFTGNLRFNTSASVVIATYIYKNKNSIPDKTTYVPYATTAGESNYKVYSGLGAGYFFTAKQQTLRISQFPSDKVIKFITHARDNTNYTINVTSGTSQHEYIPLKLVSNKNLIAQYKGDTKNDPLHNLGNWCAQYYFPITFNNDTNQDVVIKCRISCKSSATGGYAMPIINCEGTILRNALYITSTPPYWEWKTITIPANTSKNLNYQFILGANSTTNLEHQFILQN